MLKAPLFVALDVDEESTALRLAEQTAPYVGGFKVGPRLCIRYGPTLIARLARIAPVFVDNKYFDIPSTMVAAVEASFAAGASYVTVHAQAGALALKQLAALEAEWGRQRPVRVLAVTVLTSFTQDSLPSVSRAMPISDQVKELAHLAIGSGLSGLVCSVNEVQDLRRYFPDAELIVPGIRLPGAAADDQSRTAGPAEAMALGASALVVGRPIVEAVQPSEAAREFRQLIQSARAARGLS